MLGRFRQALGDKDAIWASTWERRESPALRFGAGSGTHNTARDLAGEVEPAGLNEQLVALRWVVLRPRATCGPLFKRSNRCGALPHLVGYGRVLDLGNLYGVTTVLAVDDTKPLRDFVQFTLSGLEGISVEEACDGGAALRMLHERPFDLVVTDLFLPVLDGTQILQMMRQQGLNKKTPVIVMTGDVRPQTREHVLKLGALEVLVKPFHAGRLIEATRAALQMPGEEATAGSDLRRAERLRIPVEISIPGDEVLICSTWDISPYGAFVTCESPPLWTQVTMTMMLPSGPVAVDAEIVHTREHPAGPLPAGFGCKFTEDPEVVRPLLEAFMSPDDDDDFG